MYRIPVESSDIISIGYEPKEQRLEVEFHGGRLYQYRGVSPELHEQFMRAESYGSFFNTFINNKFRFERLEEPRKLEGPKGLAFVTAGARKVQALQAALQPYDIIVEQIILPVETVQSEDASNIATKKAKDAFRLAQRPVVVTDTYWNILSLRGFPGAYMRDVAEWLRPEDFLKLMEDKPDRTIVRTDTLAYHDGKRTKVFARDYTAAMAKAPAGEGRSIDTLVVMDGQSKTIAQQYGVEGFTTDDLENTIWQDFAKWFHMQRRLGKA